VQIQPLNDELAKSMSLDSDKGALVAQVSPDSAAMAAGILSGDVIKSVDGKNVDTIKDLTRMISGMKPGTAVKLGVWRDGKDMTVSAKIGGDQKDEAKAVKASPEVNLYAADKRHPSLAGTYLAASTVYATILKKSPVGLSYSAGLDAGVAKGLQAIAWETVQGYFGTAISSR
jgi:serine protease Do